MSLEDLKKARSRQAWGEVRQKYALLQPTLNEVMRCLVEAECDTEEGNYEAARVPLETVLKRDALNAEALILLGRLEYGLGNPSTALNHFQKVKLMRRSDDKDYKKVPIDDAAFFLKGMIVCAECFAQTGQPDKASGILQQASEFASTHVILERGFPTDPVKKPIAWAAVEIRLCQGKLEVADPHARTPTWLSIFRECLRYCADLPAGLRALVVKTAGEAIVRHSCDADYARRDIAPGSESLQIPRSAVEEATLLLLLTELELSQDFGEIDFSSCATVRSPIVSGCDDVTLVLARRQQFVALSEATEAALASRFQDAGLLCKYGMALYCASEYAKCTLVFEQCLGMEESSGIDTSDFEEMRGTVMLLLARVYLNFIGRAKDAEQWAESYLDLPDRPLEAEAHHIMGVACGAQARTVRIDPERKELQQRALEHLHVAVSLLGPSNRDPKILFNLALQYADTRQVEQALRALRESLEIDSSSARSWHLLALLLSSTKDYKAALEACQAGISENPLDLDLVITRADLLEKVEGGRRALEAYEEAIGVWKRLFANGQSFLSAVGGVISPTTSVSARNDKAAEHLVKTLSGLSSLHLPENAHLSLRARSSMRRSSAMAVSEQSIAAFGPSDAYTLTPDTASIPRSTTQLTGAASSQPASKYMESPISRGFLATLGGAAMLIVDQEVLLWRNIANIFMRMGQYSNAQRCLEGATVHHPVNCDIMFQYGLMHEMQGELEEAAVKYQKVLAVEVNHLDALLHLGVVMLRMGNRTRAQTHLESAIAIDPTSHEAWFNLGLVMKENAFFEEASSFFMTALALESTAPVLSYDFFDRIV